MRTWRFNLMLIVWFATIVHIIWSAALLWPGTAAQFATPPSAIVNIFGGRLYAVCWLMFSAALAGWGVLFEKRLLAPLFLIPQNLLLGVSASAAVNAMIDSHFADGVIRDRAFLIADQSPMVVGFALHTFAVTMMFILYWRKRSY